MEIMGIGSVAVITVTCYLIAIGLKNIERLAKWVPFICGLMGAVLGALMVGVVVNFPADDVFTAVAVGIVSGLAATGINQGVRQTSGYYDID